MFDHSLEFDPVIAGDLKLRVAPVAYDNFHKFISAYLHKFSNIA
jgi:hypothetical protein